VIRLIILSFSFAALVTGCIYPYELDLTGNMDDIVILGSVTNQEGYQYVWVSRTLPLNNPETARPVTDCVVSIQDDQGNVFPCSEAEPHGKYACWIPAENLGIGSRFQLNVTLPDGRNYISDYEELLACPPIENLSWEIEPIYTQETYITHQGVRFFVTTDASEDYAQHFRWVLTETWEYHSAYKTKVFYDGEIRVPDFESDTIFYCWDSCVVDEVFTYSTENLEDGKINEFPLLLVSDQTDKLSVKYSLLVKQMAISPIAYEYWKTLEDQSKQTAELFEVQPAEIRGNIHAVDNENVAVNGLFYAATVKEKRITIRPGINTLLPVCDGFDLPLNELYELLTSYWPGQYPVYLIQEGPGQYDFTEQSCFDCRLRGGTVVEPDYW